MFMVRRWAIGGLEVARRNCGWGVADAVLEDDAGREGVTLRGGSKCTMSAYLLLESTKSAAIKKVENTPLTRGGKIWYNMRTFPFWAISSVG